ncbi:Hypothetical predicted protein [Mytilus galloprovincialis]|uniref:Uncharacterized protein n=1 Tax=Mytilus galloprovincialis TaxID=29158 RepID=A0A8B6GD97_MYTGA|nr:Hypothetical predicted protein [Mytilus galloprovincialis]
MSLLEDKYLVRVYADGSASNASTKGGAGICIKYPKCQRRLTIRGSTHRHTLFNCFKLHTAEEALIHNNVNYVSQLVFLTDDLSVLQATSTGTCFTHHQTSTDYNGSLLTVQFGVTG